MYSDEDWAPGIIPTFTGVHTRLYVDGVRGSTHYVSTCLPSCPEGIVVFVQITSRRAVMTRELQWMLKDLSTIIGVLYSLQLSSRGWHRAYAFLHPEGFPLLQHWELASSSMQVCVYIYIYTCTTVPVLHYGHTSESTAHHICQVQWWLEGLYSPGSPLYLALYRSVIIL